MKSDQPLENPGEDEDRELSVLLRRWQAPGISAGLDSRIAAVVHRQLIRLPVWKRLLTARIPVPAPVAALALLLLGATTFLAVRSHKPEPTPTPRAVAAAIAQSESPRGIPSQAAVNQNQPFKSQADSRASDPVPKKADSGSAYVTQVDLTGFEPVKELKIRVLPREIRNER